MSATKLSQEAEPLRKSYKNVLVLRLSKLALFIKYAAFSMVTDSGNRELVRRTYMESVSNLLAAQKY
jgi:hypothetical protein